MCLRKLPVRSGLKQRGPLAFELGRESDWTDTLTSRSTFMTLIRHSIHLKDLEGEILSWLKTVAAQLKDPSQKRAGEGENQLMQVSSLTSTVRHTTWALPRPK